jgi:ribosomal-protein-serine acetyltransferase
MGSSRLHQRESGGVLVRPWRADDVDGLYRAVDASREQLTRWLPWCTPDYSAADAAAWIGFSQRSWAERSLFPLGIFDSISGEVLGGTGINHLDWPNRRGALGYWVATPRAGQGIARRAARLALDIAFEDLGLARIEIIVLLENAASQRVARALGAHWECDARGRIVHQGEARTASVYAVLRE